jgi:hypothetical protein
MKPTAMLLTVMLLVTATLFIGGSFTAKNVTETYMPDCNVLAEIPTKEETIASLPKPVNKQKATPTAAGFELVKPLIGTFKQEGEHSIGCGGFPMPAEKEKGDVGKMGNDSDDLLTCNLTTEAEYPGGAAAWHRYLNKNMRFPEDGIDEEMQLSVVVKFVVDEEGNVSDAEAISGSKAFGAEAVRVIKQSGKWIPAKQLSNGRFVKSYKKQPIIIHVEVEE